jgi:molybdenum cofactor cytidylyltransferase
MSLTKKIVDITRELRRLQTPQEKTLWEKLRNRQLSGFKFLRQHPIVYHYNGYTPLFFVADFYCDQHKLVIEVDGKVHHFQKDNDANRDSILAGLGLRVLRIRNDEVQDIEGVLKRILGALNSTHPPAPSLFCSEGVSERSEDGGELGRGPGSAIAIILLAAGASSRMGQSKQQLLIEGKPLLVHSAEIAIRSDAAKVIVVLGSQEEAHQKILSHVAVDIIFNSRWQTGMGSSLKTGLSKAISNNPETEAILVMVCDQPLLTVEHINSLIQKYRKTNAILVASAYANTLGVPALFSRELFKEILNLSDEQGAKKIIQKYAVETVDFPEGSIDLDSTEDYKTFLQQHAKKIS